MPCWLVLWFPAADQHAWYFALRQIYEITSAPWCNVWWRNFEYLLVHYVSSKYMESISCTHLMWYQRVKTLFSLVEKMLIIFMKWLIINQRKHFVLVIDFQHSHYDVHWLWRYDIVILKGQCDNISGIFSRTWIKMMLFAYLHFNQCVDIDGTNR